VPIVAGLAVMTISAVATTASAGARPRSVTCGAAVTTDVRLDRDLVNCPGNGLTIAASGITIDLAGHTIDGSGTAFGIENPGGFDDVVIRRGTITDFAIGVVVFDTTDSIVEGVNSTGNLEGFAVQNATGAELDRLAAVDNEGNGISVSFSDDVVVRRSTVVGNGLGGIVDRASAGSTYERNHVSGNAFGMEIAQTEEATLERNDVVGNDGDGIHIGFDASGVRLDRNRTDANAGHGLVVDEPGNTVTRHHSSGNGGEDIVLP
jgi:nitrous oxidase accessory protein NosD